MADDRFGLCLNLKLNAISQYVAFNFNSFAIFNGVPLGASTDGIFELDSGQTDNTQAIKAFFELVTTDFGKTSPKRLRNVKVNYETSGYLLVNIKTDDEKEVEYNLVPDKTGQRQYGQKIPVSRSQQGVFWMFRVDNLGGCDFSVDSIDTLLVLLHPGR